jgi:hypothetical protein
MGVLPADLYFYQFNSCRREGTDQLARQVDGKRGLSGARSDEAGEGPSLSSTTKMPIDGTIFCSDEVCMVGAVAVC